MAHNFFTPGKTSLAVIDEMVNDKYPEPLIHEGKNVKKKEDIEQKTKKTKMIQQSKYCLANHFKAPGIRKTIFFLFFLLSATRCCDLKQRNLLPDNSQGKNLSVYNNRHLSFSVLFQPCDVLRSDNFSLHFLLYLFVPFPKIYLETSWFHCMTLVHYMLRAIINQRWYIIQNCFMQAKLF